MRYFFGILILFFALSPMNVSAQVESFTEVPNEQKEVTRDDILFVKLMISIALYVAVSLFFLAWMYGWFVWWAYSGYWGDLDHAQELLGISSVGLFGSIFVLLLYYFLGDSLIESFLRGWNNLF